MVARLCPLRVTGGCVITLFRIHLVQINYSSSAQPVNKKLTEYPITFEGYLMRPVLHHILVTGLLLALAGCSISYSVEKSSDSISESLDSISASFGSFSDSSGGGAEEAAAQMRRFSNDVSSLARLSVEEGTAPRTFEYRMTELAMRYGITDWQSETAAFMAIGSGLRQAGISNEAITGQPFLQSSLMKQHDGLIAAGFHSS
jgi:hypothetical protein